MDLNEYIAKAIIAGFYMGKELTEEIDKRIPDKKTRLMFYEIISKQLMKQGSEYLNLAREAIIEYDRIPYFKDDYKHSQDNNKV